MAFGLGIKHLGFCDAPHARAVCKLSMPLMTKLMYPSIIPAKEFARYGIGLRDLIGYRAIDPAMWLRNGEPVHLTQRLWP